MFRNFAKISTNQAQRYISSWGASTPRQYSTMITGMQSQTMSKLAPINTSMRFISNQTSKSSASGVNTIHRMAQQMNRNLTPYMIKLGNYAKYSMFPTGFVAATTVVAQRDNKTCPVNHYSYDIYGSDREYVQKVRASEKAIREAILATIEDEEGEYDGHGSYAPIYLRLAWHSSGTYDQETNTGGSNGGCMRFQPEAGHGANAGLEIARNRLEQVKKQYPFISYADLYTLAGVVACEEMNDELIIPWRPGRSDYTENKHYKVDRVRLPDGMLGADHIRDVFTKQMGFNDREITALIGAHAVGLVHSDRSGFLTRPWTYSPTSLRNNFYTTLLEEKWTLVDGPNGTKHYTNGADNLIMIPADYAFVLDPVFLKYVEEYAKDEDAWVKDFTAAFAKLLELGVPFPQ